MAEPPSHLSARRAQARARLRRRRLAVSGALLALVAVVAVAISALAGSSSGHRSRSSSKSSGGAQPAPGAAGGVHRRLAPGTATSAESLAVRRLAALGLPVYCAGPRGNAVAFTFDDGPGPYTHYALKKLTEAHERATFFLVGRSIDNFPGYLSRELRLGVLGDHTLTHPLLTGLPLASVQDQIGTNARKIEAASGQPVTLFRPPYGARNATVDAVARRLGLLDILWTIDSADSLGANWAGIIRNVEAGLHPGAIILMHENRGQTIRALTTLLPELHRRHLRSVTVPELLSHDPPSRAQLLRGGAGCSGAALRGSGG